MSKVITKRRPAGSRRKPVGKRRKGKVFTAWHLFGSVPGMDKWALKELKEMRDEW